MKMTANATNKVLLLQWKSNIGASISELKISREDSCLFSSFRLPATSSQTEENKEYMQKTVTQIGTYPSAITVPSLSPLSLALSR